MLYWGQDSKNRGLKHTQKKPQQHKDNWQDRETEYVQLNTAN